MRNSSPGSVIKVGAADLSVLHSSFSVVRMRLR